MSERNIKEGKKEGRKEGWKGRKIGCLLFMPRQGTAPATQACALTGNQTGDLLPCGTMTNELSHTSQGPYILDVRNHTVSLKIKNQKKNMVIGKKIFLKRQGGTGRIISSK